MELSPKNISVVIPTAGKRTEELEAIKHHLINFGFEDIQVIKDMGYRLYNRHLGALQAKSEWIYTQDDDVIVNNIQELINLAKNNTITANTQKEHTDFYGKDENGGGKICLIGWGAIFNREILTSIDRYWAKFPINELFFREYDRALTYLNEKTLVNGNLTHFDSAKDENMAMYREKRHWEDLKAIINNLKQL